MLNDYTSNIEQAVLNEKKPAFSHLIRLFVFGFSSTKLISCVYLGAFILLSFLRPLLAFIWGRYILAAELASADQILMPALLLLAGYFAINFFADLIGRYAYLGDKIEQLNIVQTNRQQEMLHTKMYKKLAGVSPETLEIPKINDRIAQVFNFVCSEWGMNVEVIMQSYIVIAKIVSVMTIGLALFIFNPWLCLIVLVAPLPTIWTLTVGQKMRFKFMKNNTKLLRMAEYFQNLMLSPAGKEIKTLALHDFFYNKWKRLADEYTLKEKDLIRKKASFMILFYSIMNFTIVVGSILAIVLMAMGALSLGALGSVLMLVSTLVNDTKELLTGFIGVLMKKNEAAQFFDLMELPEQHNQGENVTSVELFEAKGLNYRYPLTEKYVLKDIGLTIRKGEKIAFVGENGAGKTTMVKLITGTLAPSDGGIFINGTESRARRNGGISAVVQEPSRYVTFTAGDNVFLGDTSKQRDETEIEAAMTFTGLNDVDKNTLLGKDIGGTDLSGGQWQKLAIARAAYRNKDFIILDEPTSNLDPLAETEIFKKYISLAEDKTVVFVTHRISAASLADRIIVFSDGKIVQDGTHGELINCDGEYARLYNEQAKWYDR